MARVTVTRSAFEGLSPRARMEIVRAGELTITDDPPAPPVLASSLNSDTQLARSQWDALTPFAKSAAVKAGKTIVDTND